MKAGIYICSFPVLLFGIVLAVNSPDSISMFFIGSMEIVILLGILFGILPVSQYTQAFQNALNKINTATVDRNGSAWSMIENLDAFFRQRTLDTIFSEYKTKITL